MSVSITVCTWNIAGGRQVNSLGSWDYQPENIEYFSEELKKVDPDIVCLQETHTNKSSSVSRKIAHSTDLRYVFESPVSPSHIDNKYRLGTAIMSKLPFEKTEKILYPYPKFELKFGDGKKAKKHDKALQVVSLGGISVANTQILPITIFGYSYDQGKGGNYTKLIDKVLSGLHSPLVLCGDFNYSELGNIYPKTFKSLSLREALPDKQTRPNDEGAIGKLDHILYSPEFDLVSSDVIATNTDHFLCWAKLKFNG